MAQKRISQIAKELGVESKSIVDKCLAEGIPNIKGHMSTVSAGLEASIREWFSGAVTGNAVETAEKVHIEEVRSKTSRARKTKAAESHGDTLTMEPPTQTREDAPAVEQPAIVEPQVKVAPVMPPAPAAPGTPRATPEHATPIHATPIHATPIPPAAPAAPAPAPAAAAAGPAPAPVASGAVEAPAAPASEPQATKIPPRIEIPASSIASMPSSISATRPPSRTTGKPGSTPPPSAPAKPEQSRPGAAPGAPPAKPAARGPEQGPGSTRQPPRSDQMGRGAPAPMNVPQRPTAVSPAGPRLENRTPVKLSGPKVVRIEAPEQVESPRPRRAPSAGGGTGPRPPGGGTADDRSRSPRRSDAPKRSSGGGVPDRRRGLSSNVQWTGGVISEQDLYEREQRMLRAGGFLKKRTKDMPKSAQGGQAEQADGRVRITAPFTLKDLSAATGVKVADISKKLFLMGIMTKINEALEPAKGVEVMMEFDIDLEVTEAKTAEETVSSAFVDRVDHEIRARGPVVTILGHVDHGKTSLLDKIRNANVAAGEAGGITQKTSAFVSQVEVEGAKKQIVFLDTPGHEAFTSMRSRGAKMTDVVVLVVSAPEGVMPQTIESINHAKAAKVPIVVALNKIDRPDATESQVQKTLGELAKAGLNPAEWGGDTEVIRTSATTGVGIKELLEALDYQAQLLDLKADFDGPAQGTVIESKVEEGRGAVANLLVQRGKLEVGNFVVMGRSFGRIRDITNDMGKRVREAQPPMPVQISGIDEVCDAGDKFYVVDTLKKAQEAAEQRRMRERQLALAQPKVTLDSLFGQMTDKEVKEILVVLKTDQQGTVDVLKGECEKVKGTEVRVRVLHAAVGGITESDIVLADASRAVVIGFNVIPSGKARQLAEQKGIEIRTYQVIYDITDDLKKAAEGLLAPEVREEVLGHAEVRQVFKVSKVGSIAGCYITDGTVQRDALIRVTRNGVVVEHDRRLAQLKRLKDDAKEVRAGMECGMKIDGYDDIKEGDVLECYKKVEVKRTL